MLKLSEAIVLGDTLKTCDPGEWLTSDGSCGCAFGGALLATGVKPEEFNREYYASPLHQPDWFKEMPCVMSRWPWLKPEHVATISSLYYQADAGHRTIEDIANYVRGVEPAEQSTTGILDAQEVAEVA